MKRRRTTSCASAALAAAALVAAEPCTAHAWNQETHDKIARESILFMLRNPIAAVRLAGVLVVHAGEGSRAAPDGRRLWPLSEEAQDTDNYLDVALRNAGNTPGVPELVRTIPGMANFTAYNHFLLWGQDTSGESVESYLVDKNGYRWLAPFAGMGEHVWLDKHDNYPGYALAADTSIDPDNPELGGAERTQALLIRMVSTREFQQWCKDKLEDAFGGSSLDESLEEIPLVGDHLRLLYEVLTIVNPLHWVKEVAIAWIAGMCPFAVGDWDHSPAMSRYALNHSTIEPSDVSGLALMDIRWHPADNMATSGVRALLHLSRFDPVSEFRPPRTETEDCDRLGLKPKACVGGTDGVDEAFARERAREKYGTDQPFYRGNLVHLGRMLHAMGDIAVPGHVSGRLLHPEHLVVEGTAHAAMQQFYTYADGDETTSATGAVQARYTTVGDTSYELEGLIDVEAAQALIAKQVRRSDFASRSIEDIAEKAAQRASRLAEYYRNAGAFDSNSTESGIVSPAIRREFLTYAFANNVVALTRAVQMFYQEKSSRPWSEMVAEVTWTERDAELAEQPSIDPSMPPTRLGFSSDLTGPYGYNLNVDAFYEERQWIDRCFVDPSKSSPVGPALPNFVPTDQLAVDLVLAGALPEEGGDKAPIGGDSNLIHVTGAYSAGKMHVEYYRGSLKDSAGAVVRLPAGAIAEGVAVWCSGPDVWNTERLDEEGKAVPALPCGIAEIRPVNARECTPRESIQFLGDDPVLVDDGGTGHQPPPIGGVGVVPIRDVAVSLGARPEAVNTALAPVSGGKATLVYPAATGRAAIVWKRSGETNVVSIGDDGGVSVMRTRKFAPR